MSSFLSRQFTFVIDPECLPGFHYPYHGILDLVTDLRSFSPPVDIHLLLPAYLATPSNQSLAQYATPPFQRLNKPSDRHTFTPDSHMPDDVIKKLLEDDDESKRVRSLLAIAAKIQADALTTSSETLVGARHAIYDHHRIRIIALDELSDVVETCAHGHGLFWSAALPNRDLSVDIFYQRTHWKNYRLCLWTDRARASASNNELKEHLRSAFFNRYSYVLYGRDMIRFYELQRDHSLRRQYPVRFVIPLTYHVASFYFLLWGMLEQLTLIANYKTGLAIKDDDCGIRNPEFWKALEPRAPALTRFIKSAPINDWITLMADMRHLAAHGGIPMPTYLLEDTEESLKGDDEILGAVRTEFSDFYSDLPQELMRTLEPTLIGWCRNQARRVIAEGVVYIERKGRRYMRNPVASVDYDLERLNAVIDAFLIALFSEKTSS